MSEKSFLAPNTDGTKLADYALVDFNGKKVWLFVDDHLPSILVPIAPTEKRESFNHKMLGFHFLDLQINGGNFEKYLAIKPPKSELHDVFLSFKDSVIDEIGNQSTLDSVISTVIAKYDEWSEFFGTALAGGDSTPKVIGLIGELLVLEEFVKLHGPAALSNWWGPVRHRHDFEFEKSAIEVKATINLQSNEIEVHGIKQLLPDPGRVLYLAHLRINLSPDGANLLQLIQRIASFGVSIFELNEKISKSGVTETMIDSFHEFKFIGASSRYFVVDQSFPALTPDIISPQHWSRISNVSYKVSLDGLSSSIELPSISQ